MTDPFLDRITDAVCRRLEHPLPRALCIGTPPEEAAFIPTPEPPWDMVVICTLSPAELLSMPTDPVCRALLRGIPVYLMEDGLEHRKIPPGPGRILRMELLAKERRLRELGIQPWGKPRGGLITAADVRRLGRDGVPTGARLTPLARDILEGRA